MTALAGDVQRWDGSRWVVVLAACTVPVTDRRTASRLFDGTRTFGGPDPRGRPVPPRNPHDHVHVRRWP